MLRVQIAMLVAALALPVFARGIAVVDDAGRPVRLERPAHRIVSLAPHITETLFAAGAGDFVVGTVRFSDFPPAARKIPRVGDQMLLDLERIVALNPDLIVVWSGAGPMRQVASLERLGIPVFESNPRRLGDIPSSLVRMGRLAGTEPVARRSAARYAARLQALRERYAARPRVRVFYQVWRRPLLTISGTQIIGDAIRTCGGRNVFEDRAVLVPAVDPESVVAANPEAIVASEGDGDIHVFDDWRGFPAIEAVAAANLALIPGDTLVRASPRMLDGTQRLCEALEAVRGKRTGREGKS